MNEIDEEWGDDPFADPLPTPAAAQPSLARTVAPREASYSGDDADTTRSIDEMDDDALAEELLPSDKSSFEVNDVHGASWVVRKIVEARARQERIKEWAAAEMREAKREEEFFQRRFGPGLEAWVTENLNGKKTLRLPDGTLGYRRKRMTLQIEDSEQLLDWCKRNLPEAVRVKEDVLKTPLNEHLKETGEVPPGCEVDAGGDEFYVR